MNVRARSAQFYRFFESCIGNLASSLMLVKNSRLFNETGISIILFVLVRGFYHPI